MSDESKKFVIKKVWMNKNTGYKAVSLPKESEFEAGDYVLIRKIDVEELENGEKTN